MATHKSALKEQRRSVRRRARNRSNRSRMRTAVKRFRAAVEAGELAQARELLAPTLAIVDRAAKLGAVRDGTVARTKSRLARALNRAASASS
jgi:small subunit ribosomal protein S20